jgi:hypothetical protein
MGGGTPMQLSLVHVESGARGFLLFFDAVADVGHARTSLMINP